MKNNAIKWLYAVPKNKKLYVLALMLRNIVDNATAHDKAGFWHYVLLTVLLVLGQIAIRAVIRWLNELSKSTFENIFKARLIIDSSIQAQNSCRQVN